MVMSVLPVQCFANESDTRIRLGYYDLEEFLIGASEDEPKSGFAYELFCEIATVNGWEYEFIYGDFSDLLAKLYAGEIDLLPCVVYSDERAETLLFSDDYIKVMKKRNLGLTEIQKLALQIVIGIFVAIYCGKFTNSGTLVYIPFWKNYVDFGWFYYPFVVFVVVAMTNAVNLTDGLDGLAASVTGIVALALFIAMYVIQGFAGTGSIAALILCGACAGFLIFNHFPAKVFMGDTGSLALGGALTAIAISGGMHFLLPLTGLIYVLEALSVIIQVLVFKTQNGRRFFRMAPLHHHFELGGMHETKVVAMFCAVTAVMGVIVILFA